MSALPRPTLGLTRVCRVGKVNLVLANKLGLGRRLDLAALNELAHLEGRGTLLNAHGELVRARVNLLETFGRVRDVVPVKVEEVGPPDLLVQEPTCLGLGLGDELARVDTNEGSLRDRPLCLNACTLGKPKPTGPLDQDSPQPLLPVLISSTTVSLPRPRWITRFMQDGGQPHVGPHSQIGQSSALIVPSLWCVSVCN